MAACAAFFLMAGCQAPGAPKRFQDMAGEGASLGFSVAAEAQTTAPAMLLRSGGSGRLRVYIEGDGAGWTAYRPPPNPTPGLPLAWELAKADRLPSVAYLARPCQYLPATMLKNCNPAWWIERRFANEVLEQYQKALDALKARSGADRLGLAGYSGGGVIATLLAMRRPDVDELITIAAPLALGEWLAHHGLSPLPGSLDPATQGLVPARVRAHHFVGARDRVVPPPIAEAFVRRQGGRLARMAGYDHACCWAQNWPTLLETLEER